MLMAVVVYLYTVIAFNFFRKFYTKEEDEEKEENCKRYVHGKTSSDTSCIKRAIDL